MSEYSRSSAIRKVMRIKSLSKADATRVVDQALRLIQRRIDESKAIIQIPVRHG